MAGSSTAVKVSLKVPCKENTVDSTQLKGNLASIVAMAATVAANFLFAVALRAFVLLESDRF